MPRGKGIYDDEDSAQPAGGPNPTVQDHDGAPAQVDESELITADEDQEPPD